MKGVMMWNKLADEWNAFVNLGEKENKNGENSSVGDTSSNDRVNASSNNE